MILSSKPVDGQHQLVTASAHIDGSLVKLTKLQKYKYFKTWTVLKGIYLTKLFLELLSHRFMVEPEGHPGDGDSHGAGNVDRDEEK